MHTHMAQRCIMGYRTPFQPKQPRLDRHRCRCYIVASSRNRLPEDAFANIARPAIALSIIYTIAFHARPANAADGYVWKPRRHHRRMGEHLSDHWAEDTVEKEEQVNQHLYLQQRADELAREQALQEAEMKRQAKAAMAEKAVTQVYVSPAQQAKSAVPADVSAFADFSGTLVWIMFLGAAFWVYQSNFFANLFTRIRNPSSGKWVYDRSLGGKQVWVPQGSPVKAAGAPQVALQPLKDEDFDKLTTIAAAASSRSSKSNGSRAGPFRTPDWWGVPVPERVSLELRTALQREAEKWLSKLETSKTLGQDYELQHLLNMFAACKHGGVSVKPGTVGQRDALYRSAVEAAIRFAIAPHECDLGDTTPLQFIGTAAAALNYPTERAVKVAQACVAATCRARLVEAIGRIREGNDTEAVLTLLRMSELLARMPVFGRGGAEPELIASSLADRSTIEERKKLFILFAQLAPEAADVVAEMLGFNPELVIPQLELELQQQGRKTTARAS